MFALLPLHFKEIITPVLHSPCCMSSRHNHTSHWLLPDLLHITESPTLAPPNLPPLRSLSSPALLTHPPPCLLSLFSAFPSYSSCRGGLSALPSRPHSGSIGSLSTNYPARESALVYMSRVFQRLYTESSYTYHTLWDDRMYVGKKSQRVHIFISPPTHAE